MKKFLSVLALFLIIVGCSTAPAPSEPPVSQFNVRETWSGFAKGSGGDCPDTEVEIKILEDFSIIGNAYSPDYDLKIRLKGKLSYDGQLKASGTGSGFNVTYKGKFLSNNTASGRWNSSYSKCYGTWKLAKNE